MSDLISRAKQMNEIFITGQTLPEAYHKALLELQKAPVIPCPDWNTNQKEVSMTFVVEEPLKEPMISRLFYGDPRSLEQYRQEMLDGIMDFEVEKGNWAYTYHQRYTHLVDYDDEAGMIDYFNQAGFVVEELKRNPYSRRAVMDIRASSDIYNHDPACWQHAQYFIRDDKLHCKILFRSNDACKAAFMNAFALIMLQKRIADELGVEVGTYTHRANSFHCYERDFELLDGYCKRIEDTYDYCKGLFIAGLDFCEDYINAKASLCYNYAGEWDELMDAEKVEIAKMVEELRNK